MGYTSSFLPKPVAGINGSGMHTNISLSKRGHNIFFDKAGEEGLSNAAWNFVDRLLSNAEAVCLALNPSVNAYRRLDPHFEAPNQISASAVDRTSMVRIPIGNQKSARVEVRTVAPDANPYLAFYTLIKAGLEGAVHPSITPATRKIKSKTLPTDIYSAMEHFGASSFITEAIGESNQRKYVEVKRRSADRCPRELGTHVKTGEVLFHHEVTNQSLWGRF
jgi:glutamine synthetase